MKKPQRPHSAPRRKKRVAVSTFMDKRVSFSFPEQFKLEADSTQGTYVLTDGDLSASMTVVSRFTAKVLERQFERNLRIPGRHANACEHVVFGRNRGLKQRVRTITRRNKTLGRETNVLLCVGQGFVHVKIQAQKTRVSARERRLDRVLESVVMRAQYHS
jgi:hypothetical protein